MYLTQASLRTSPLPTEKNGYKQRHHFCPHEVLRNTPSVRSSPIRCLHTPLQNIDTTLALFGRRGKFRLQVQTFTTMLCYIHIVESPPLSRYSKYNENVFFKPINATLWNGKLRDHFSQRYNQSLQAKCQTLSILMIFTTY